MNSVLIFTPFLLAICAGQHLAPEHRGLLDDDQAIVVTSAPDVAQERDHGHDDDHHDHDHSAAGQPWGFNSYPQAPLTSDFGGYVHHPAEPGSEYIYKTGHTIYSSPGFEVGFEPVSGTNLIGWAVSAAVGLFALSILIQVSINELRPIISNAFKVPILQLRMFCLVPLC